MKHPTKTTWIMLGLFLLAQFIGLGIVYQYIDTDASALSGEIEFKDVPGVERPEVEENISFIPIIVAILIGTVLMLFLMKHKLTWVWKIWFLFAVVVALGVALSAFMPVYIAFSLALLFGVWKIFRPGFVVQTLTELLIYGGLAAIFVPLFDLLSISILLVLIMIYDAYAVWKSKHMITLAKSQSKEKIFAGLLVPHSFKGTLQTKKPARKTSKKRRVAMLGGGDIGFPLFFAGVVLKEIGLWQALIIPFFALGGLAFLLYIGKKNKFYPAMPFIGAACFVGLGIVWFVTSFLTF